MTGDPGSTRTKIVSREELRRLCARERDSSHRIVFANGAFDLLHAGGAVQIILILVLESDLADVIGAFVVGILAFFF